MVDGDVWIPIPQGVGRTMYFSPAQGRSLWHLPHGVALASTAVSRSQTYLGDHPSEEVAAWSGNQSNHTVVMRPVPTLVPKEDRKSCMPHCTWTCSTPVCEQDCKPDCKVPVCETRCPKLGPDSFSGCKAKCTEPSCAMFCPKNFCNGTKTLSCATPKCLTHCEQPKCHLQCGRSLGCKSWCPEPHCKWRCRRPKACPLPKCRMRCEQAPDCSKHTINVPMPEGFETVGAGVAVQKQLEWKVSDWSGCDKKCGMGHRMRVVTCSAGDSKDCELSGPKPHSKEGCREYSGCDWHTSEWSGCSTRCEPGQRTREVRCSGPQDDSCRNGRSRPASVEECDGGSATCDECVVKMFSSGNLTVRNNSWMHEFNEGEYSAAELEFQGVKCDDISSMEVIGFHCKVTVYEYGDFNEEHRGFKATFPEGQYSRDDLVSGGAANNDISSFKVIKEHKAGAMATSAPVTPLNATANKHLHHHRRHKHKSSGSQVGALTAVVVALWAALW